MKSYEHLSFAYGFPAIAVFVPRMAEKREKSACFAKFGLHFDQKETKICAKTHQSSLNLTAASALEKYPRRHRLWRYTYGSTQKTNFVSRETLIDCSNYHLLYHLALRLVLHFVNYYPNLSEIAKYLVIRLHFLPHYHCFTWNIDWLFIESIKALFNVSFSRSFTQSNQNNNIPCNLTKLLAIFNIVSRETTVFNTKYQAFYLLLPTFSAIRQAQITFLTLPLYLLGHQWSLHSI